MCVFHLTSTSSCWLYLLYKRLSRVQFLTVALLPGVICWRGLRGYTESRKFYWVKAAHSLRSACWRISRREVVLTFPMKWYKSPAAAVIVMRSYIRQTAFIHVCALYGHVRSNGLALALSFSKIITAGVRQCDNNYYTPWYFFSVSWMRDTVTSLFCVRLSKQVFTPCGFILNHELQYFSLVLQ